MLSYVIPLHEENADKNNKVDDSREMEKDFIFPMNKITDKVILKWLSFKKNARLHIPNFY